jgi:hypothetical protein
MTRSCGYRGRPARMRLCGLVACAVAVGSREAHAFEVGGGVGLGVFLAGTAPHLSVSPHATFSWRADSGFLLGAELSVSILPATNGDGVGVYGHPSLVVGYATENKRFSLGPSLAVYSLPACAVTSPGHESCGRASGVAPGGHMQASIYFAGPLGVSAIANVEWLSGPSELLHDVVAATLIAGPVVRWR